MNKDITKFDREKWCKNSAGKNGAKFGRKIVAKIGRKLLQRLAKSCKNRPKNVAKVGRKIVAKLGPKSWEIRPRKMYTVWPKSSADNCCKRKQMQSISAMNSQSSINWVTILQNSNLIQTKILTTWMGDVVQLNVDQEASTFWWEASVDRSWGFNLFGRPPSVDRRTFTSIGTTWCTLVDRKLQPFDGRPPSVDRDHVVYVVVSKSVNLRVLSL